MRHLFIVFMLIPFAVFSASPDSLYYVDAASLPVIGKGFANTENRYERLPANLETQTRPPVWRLSKNCSGLAIRFRSNSSTIGAKWEVTGDVVMNHFTPTGIKGLDLYALRNGKWQFVNSGRPVAKATTALIISNMPQQETEYMLYLPLYDGLEALEIGIDAGSWIKAPQLDSPKTGNPIVFYGTSITQGGCASRAGMAYPNILSRLLNHEIVNLGFSGNGQLDLEIAGAMATIPSACFVMDCLPNVTVAQMNEKYQKFLDILRAENPSTPIILIESILFPHMYFDQSVCSLLAEKNATLRQIYEENRANGDANIHYVKADKLIGDSFEATVDGIHLTDLGFQIMARELYPVIQKHLQ